MTAQQNIIPLETKRRKRKQAQLSAEQCQEAIALWNDKKPKHWVSARYMNQEKREVYSRFVAECDGMFLKPAEVMKDALSEARRNEWANRQDVKLEFVNFMRKLVWAYAEKWADRQARMPKVEAPQQVEEMPQTTAQETRLFSRLLDGKGKSC